MTGTETAAPATVYLEVDGKPEPATRCHWIEISPCGCVAGISRASIGGPGWPGGLPLQVYYAGADAFLRDRPKAVREYEATLGHTYQLITGQQYRDTYMALMGNCSHTPKWGLEPTPVPDGWAWQTTDRGYGRNSYRKHIVPARVDAGDMAEVTALCGKTEKQWRWSGEWHHMTDTVPCKKCATTARETAADPECGVCLKPVDANGETTTDCPVSPPATCGDCGACLCDGSC